MSDDTTRTDVETFVTELQACAQSRTVYASDHPQNREAVARAAATLARALRGREEIVLGVIANDIVFERAPLHRASRVAVTLIPWFRECGIQRVAFRRGVDEAELSAFLGHLAERNRGVAGAGLRHIRVGALDAAALQKPEDAADDVELAASLEQGANLVREIADALHGHRPLDVNAARAVVGKILSRLIENRDSVLVAFSLRRHDEYSFVHSVNVSVLAMALAEALGVTGAALAEVGMAGLLHDAGKLAVAGGILRKQGKLSAEEFEAMKTHPLEGAKILLRTPDISPMVVVAAFEHHVRYDGTGYPTKVFGESLSLPGMIVAIADVYEALRATRPYREAMSPETAHQEMMKMSGTYFHPDLVGAFFRLIGVYPPGTLVRLNDQSVGVVRRANPGAIFKPQVEVLYGPDGSRLPKPYLLNLLAPPSEHAGRSILHSVAPGEGFELPADLRQVASAAPATVPGAA